MREAMEAVTVFHRGQFSGWGCANVTLQIRVGEQTFTAEIGEDGCIATADLADPDGSRKYWCARDGELFKILTGAE